MKEGKKWGKEGNYEEKYDMKGKIEGSRRMLKIRGGKEVRKRKK